MWLSTDAVLRSQLAAKVCFLARSQCPVLALGGHSQQISGVSSSVAGAAFELNAKWRSTGDQLAKIQL